MKLSIIEKLESIGGIEKIIFCTADEQKVEDALMKIEALFNCYLPPSYKEFYKQFGAFNFKNLISVKCIDSDPIMLPGNRLNVGNFYCVTEGKTKSVIEVLRTYQEQLPEGLLPICDGELGDVICISLRKDDYGCIFYFYHESEPDKELFLIAKSFENFMLKLEIHKGSAEDSEMLKNMKVELTPEFIALLKRDGYGPKS